MTLPIDDLAGKIGEPLGVSGWIEVSQEHIVVEVDGAPKAACAAQAVYRLYR
jgi:N6-adenosine-specific RNA methylase IME4